MTLVSGATARLKCMQVLLYTTLMTLLPEITARLQYMQAMQYNLSGEGRWTALMRKERLNMICTGRTLVPRVMMVTNQGWLMMMINWRCGEDGDLTQGCI